MQKEIIISGFGGQGVLFAGQVIAYAAMDAGKQVTWIPSYGPEMRGGTANCTVVIADQEIGSPLVKNPPLVIALNLPSFDKYEHEMQAGGTLVVNQSMVDRGAKRTDIHAIFVPANEIAEEIGDKRLTNMVTVGALLAALPEVTLEGCGGRAQGASARASPTPAPQELSSPAARIRIGKEQLAVAA